MTDRLAHLSRLKQWLDAFRPPPAAVLKELRRLYAVDGNTLTQTETELVIGKG